MTDEPNGTGNMWANMLGLGPLFATINDPGFQQHIRQIVESITATAERCQRIEIKLDLLLQASALDHVHIERIERIATIPVELGPAGTRGPAIAGGTADHGTGHDPPIGEGDAERLDDHPRPYRVARGVSGR